MSDEIDTRERMLDAALRPAPDLTGPERTRNRRDNGRRATAA
jgi:hypothetical protein